MKPLAPDRSESKTYVSSPKVVKMSTRADGTVRVIRRVASIPSSTGMRMSISTTSGLTRLTAATASEPSAASATTSRSASASRIFRRPVRIIAWSSATTTVVIGSAAARAP